MRTIERTAGFKRDYKREAKGAHRSTLYADLTAVLKALAQDHPLPDRYRDHPLTGNWKDHRDCHLKPDLILIYRKPDPDTLQLVRSGRTPNWAFDAWCGAWQGGATDSVLNGSQGFGPVPRPVIAPPG